MNAEERTIRVHRSRHLGAEADTKTTKSRLIIRVSPEIIDFLQDLHHPWQKGSDNVFLTKTGTPIDAGQWAKDYWQRVLDGLEIPRKFYATRHTFITAMAKAGANLKELADYAGTSVQMIEDNYCARQNFDPTESSGELLTQ